EAQIIDAVVRCKLVSTDLEPLFCCGDACRAERIDAQSDGRAPRHGVLDEFHLLAVVGEKKRAGTLEPLLGQHFLVRFRVELGAGNAIGPKYPDDVYTRLLSQAEVNLRSGNRPLLQQQAGANLDRAADD